MIKDWFTGTAVPSARTLPQAAKQEAVPASVAGHRYAYLDVIRGLAALLVVVTHILESGVPGFREAAGQVCNSGLLGVLLFFIVSGVVINASIERASSLKAFWLQRFWRLYPAYWVSLLGSLVLFLLVPGDLNFAVYGNLKDHFWAAFGANITMIQGFLGYSHYIPAYWTLGFEIFFYFMLTVTFAFGFGKHSHQALWLISAFLIAAATYSIFKGVHIGGFKVLLCGYFWLGTWIHRYIKQQVSSKLFWAALLTFHLGVFLTWYTNFQLHPPKMNEVFGEFPMSPTAMLVAFLGSTLLFFALFSLRTKQFPKPLLMLGTVSYSLYLFHALSIRLGGMMFDPSVDHIPYVLATTLFTIVLTGLAYRFVEVPSLNRVKAVKQAGR